MSTITAEFALTAEEQHDLQAQGAITLYRPLVWQALEANYNLNFSGVVVGEYCTGAPEHGWVLYSRRGDQVWEQRTKREFPPLAAGSISDGFSCLEVKPVRGGHAWVWRVRIASAPAGGAA